MTTLSGTTSALRTRFSEAMTWVLGAILVVNTSYGLLSDHAYRLDRRLELESFAQDVLTLAIVPVLIGTVLGAVVLVKIVTMGLAILAMAIAIVLDGGTPDWPVVGLFAVMIAVSTTVLVRGAHRLGHPARQWLRPELWQR